MPKDDLPILNLSNPKHKRVLIDYIKSLSGNYRFELTKVRDQRSLSQNAYMHGVIFPLVAMGLTAVRGEIVNMLDAKDEMKDRFLRRPRIDKRTGEVLAYYTAGTSDLDTEECAAFIDKVVQFALDELGVGIPAPDEYEMEQQCQATAK